jgi:hypothetical protein
MWHLVKPSAPHRFGSNTRKPGWDVKLLILLVDLLVNRYPKIFSRKFDVACRYMK